jgi:hypothetical protein
VCDLYAENRAQTLIVLSARPGTESHGPAVDPSEKRGRVPDSALTTFSR